MNALQVAPDYIRDERDFLYTPPLSLADRFRRLFKPQLAAEAQAYPLNWVPGIDISGIGQTKEIALAFPHLVAAGWKLLIMRASVGLTPDVLFDYFWRAGLDAGMYLMAYHFGYTGYSGISQANLFLKTIDPMLTAVEGHSAGILDVEAPGDVAAWRSVVTNFHTTIKPVLLDGDYSSVSKWLSCTNNMGVPGFGYNAAWSSLTDVPSFAPKEKTRIRQVGVHLKHSWVPVPSGVHEDVDVDYFMGDEEALRDFLGYDEIVPPPPPPSDLEKKVDTLIAINHSEHQKMQEDLGNLALLNVTEHMDMKDDIANLVARVDAIVAGGTPVNKPAFQIGGDLANCRVIKGYNEPDPPATPKPIMAIPPVGPHRIQFKAGQIVLLASNKKVDADGSIWYYRVDPSQYPASEPDQYLRDVDGVLV